MKIIINTYDESQKQADESSSIKIYFMVFFALYLVNGVFSFEMKVYKSYRNNDVKW